MAVLTGASLLVTLLCAALGLALSFAPAKAIAPSAAIVTATALAAAAFIGGNHLSQQQALIGCSISIVVTALAVHAPGGVRLWPALLLAANAGAWCGAVASLSAAPRALLALPLVLVALPGRWIVLRRRAILLKVLSGWLVAVAALTAALPLITTPGYQPDHME